MSIEEPPQGSAEEGAHATLRAAWLVSGVREALPLDDGLPARVLPLPDLRDGRQVPQLLEQALTRIGFVTKIDVPVWMAGTARDLSLVIAGAQTGPMPETAAMLEATLRRALDVAALTMGATPVMVGGVVEVLEGETWRPLALQHPPRPPLGRPLERRAAEGEVVARLHPGATWAALDVDPRLRIWTALYAKAAAETDLDLLVLGHMALLETVASGLADKAVAPAGETLLLADGTPAEAKNLRVRVYGLVRWALAVLGSPDTILLAGNASPLWEECGVWVAWRNAVVHDGGLRGAGLPAGKRAVHDRVLQRAVATVPGAGMEEGLERYASAVAAAGETVCTAAAAVAAASRPAARLRRQR